jgi:cell division septum initiation protein DivIVA
VTFGDLARSLEQTVAELTALFAQVRQERVDLAAAGQHAREEAERIIAAALADASRTQADAAAEARRVLDDARAQAIALTRDAIVTVEGLRRVHEADEPPRAPDAG